MWGGGRGGGRGEGVRKEEDTLGLLSAILQGGQLF